MKANVLFLIVWLGLLLFVAVGCMVRETAVTPTGTAVLIVESVDTPTQSPTPQPTATSQPTAVPTSTPLPTSTNTPASIPTDTSISTPISTAKPEIKVVSTIVSSMGEWVATVEEINTGSQLTRTLKVTNSLEQLEWIADTVSGEPMFVHRPFPFSWSQDEQTFYFTHFDFGDGCSALGNGIDMYRLHLMTGVVEEIVSEGYWFAFSPDEKRLAYLSHDRGLVIRDLTSNNEIETQFSVKSENEWVDMIGLMWSPDGNSILTIAGFEICLDGRYSLIRVDTTTLEQTVLIDKRGSLDQIISWPETARALLKLDYEEFAWVNTTTGELTPAEE
jgi:WD40 repeat protein